MVSPQELRNLAWNCRSLSRWMDEPLESSLRRMATHFERKAVERDRLREPVAPSPC
jgi:hypothetical protein